MPRIDFPTRVDWHERQMLLKAAFPVNSPAEKPKR
jgi:alpha-mannosidase